MIVYRVKKATDIQMASFGSRLASALLRLVPLKCRRAAALIAKPPITGLRPSLKLSNLTSMAFNQPTTAQI